MVPKSAARPALASPRDVQSLVKQVAWYDKEVEGYYLSPSAPGVPDYLEAVVREVVQDYAVEGLHLDFIRYPGPSYDYSAAALKGFHPEPGDALEAALVNPTLYGDYLREKLTSLADRLARAARAGRPGIQVSAAVVADEAVAVSSRYQDWPRWLARGILDALCPMAYTPDTRVFRAQVVQARSRVSMGQALWAGVGAYRLSLGEIVEKIQVARDVGVSGVILFSHESLSPSEWRALQVQVFPSGSLSLGHAQP
jgi:uncharacterized lipoprotein YddW (UPF0748 family)